MDIWPKDDGKDDEKSDVLLSAETLSEAMNRYIASPQPRSVSRPLIAAVATSDDHVKAGDGAGNDISDEGGIYVIRESMLNLPL